MYFCTGGQNRCVVTHDVEVRADVSSRCASLEILTAALLNNETFEMFSCRRFEGWLLHIQGQVIQEFFC